MQYAYPCKIVGNEHDGDGFAVTFPDVYGANTGGRHLPGGPGNG